MLSFSCFVIVCQCILLTRSSVPSGAEDVRERQSEGARQRPGSAAGRRYCCVLGARPSVVCCAALLMWILATVASLLKSIYAL